LKLLDQGNTKKITLDSFLKLKEIETNQIERALRNDLVLKDFPSFCQNLEVIAREVQENVSGKNGQSIPQVSKSPVI
jgi:hypothetical protein